MRFLEKMQGTTVQLLVFALFLFAKQSGVGSVPYPDFDQSMLREPAAHASFEKMKSRYYSSNPILMSLFKGMYEKNKKEIQQEEHLCEEYRIPRIIHQIWLGGEVPAKFQRWMKSWADLNGWEYKLWTDKNIPELLLYNQPLYDQAACYVERSDILRLEILYQYGGVYADIDYECFNTPLLEDLHKSFDFYIGFEPLEHGIVKKLHMFKVCNALIGAIPGHPLVKDLLENMTANYFAYRPHASVLERTGPSYLTRIICQYEKSHAHTQRNMYFPCTFFYPYTRSELENLIEKEEAIALFPETLGIHYWSGSWHGIPPIYTRYSWRTYDGEHMYGYDGGYGGGYGDRYDDEYMYEECDYSFESNLSNEGYSDF